MPNLACSLFVISFILWTGISSAAEKPNFVWLISEDNSKHFLKLFDEHGSSTPRIEELAKEGLVFKHAFSNAPVCSVARTTLMTCCYAPRIGTQFHRKSKLVPMPEGLKMFPGYLREAGYYTTNNNKKDYNAIEGEGIWDESSGRATWRNRKDGQPFFHKQTFKTTHESSLHFTRQQMKRQTTDTDPATVFLPPYHPDTPTFRYTYARYHDRMKEVDQQMGVVIDQLKEDGLMDDTFIFYFGDHGGVLPRGKGYAYETGLHVPLVVRVPKKWQHLVSVPPSSTVDSFVGFIDFGATLLKLAGVDLPNGIDGRPFLGKGVDTEAFGDEAFGYADRFDEKYDLVRTLRKGKYSYVRNYQPFNFDGLQNNYRYKMLAFAEWRELYDAGKLNKQQRQFFETRPVEALYDIETDPYEVNNLADDPKYADLVVDMRNRLTEKVKSLPDLSLYPESFLVDKAFNDPVGFGHNNKAEIAELVDVANLSLVSPDDAMDGLTEAIKSPKPWVRYWGLITLSCHGESMKSFIPTADRIAKNDPIPLVRVRAAEFLALIGAADPEPVIVNALRDSSSGIEQNLILNTLVLLRDGATKNKFSLNRGIFGEGKLYDQLERRLLYLDVGPNSRSE